MSFKLENKYVVFAGELLAKVPMKAGRSRHRQRIIKLLNENLALYNIERDELLKEFAMLDETGELVSDEEGQAVFGSDVAKQGFIDSVNELNNEFVIIEGEQNMSSLKKVYHGLDETDMRFADNDAVIYDYLMEALEDALKV